MGDKDEGQETIARDERQQQERTARDNSKRLETTEKTTVRYEKNKKSAVAAAQ